MLSLQIKQILDKGFSNSSYKLQAPEVKTHGHLATNIAFVVAKEKKMNPMQAAGYVKEFLTHATPAGLIKQIDIAAPGFINIWFTNEAIQKEFVHITKAKVWGKTNIGQSEKVIVEYSSPNIGKPMHVGHFRSTIIGDAIANIHEFLGYKTIRWNYLGDWGVQFGKLTAAYKLWGDEKKLRSEPIKHLLELYVRFSAEAKENPELENKGQEEFKKLEAGDPANRKMWQKFRAEAVKEFNKMYKTLGVEFDISLGESFYEKDLRKIIEYLIHEEIAVRSEGALIIPLDDLGLPPAMIEKSDGATLYLTRDIANVIYRIKKYRPAKIIYEIGSEQELHFKQLFAVTKSDFLKGFYKEHADAKQTELTHVGHGLVLGEDGKKLSTRAGKTIFMEDVITEAIEKTSKIIHEKTELKDRGLSSKEKDKIAKVVAIGALKYNDLSQNRLSNITFDWDKMLSFEGDSGPYLQYSYARLKSILRKAHHSKLQTTHYKLLNSDLELEIILKLDRFPEVLFKIAGEDYLRSTLRISAEQKAQKASSEAEVGGADVLTSKSTLVPAQGAGSAYFTNDLAAYLYDLAKSVNHYYQVEPILKADTKTRNARLALIATAAHALKTGLNLLGIDTLERM